MSSRRTKDPKEGSLWSDVCSKVKNLDKQRKEVDQYLHSINKSRERIVQKKEEFNGKYAEKLKKSYNEAVAAVKKEQSLLLAAQDKLVYLISLSESPGYVPEKPQFVERPMKKKPDLYAALPAVKKTPFPPLCGPTPASATHVFPENSLVAARTGKEMEWIAAVVVKQYSDFKKYDILDYDEENSEGGAKRYTLPSKNLVPLPTSLPPVHMKHEFPENSKVLALYPNTTCFYMATVISPPSKTGIAYKVIFEEEEEIEGGIPQFEVLPQHVLPLPKVSKKKE